MNEHIKNLILHPNAEQYPENPVEEKSEKKEEGLEYHGKCLECEYQDDGINCVIPDINGICEKWNLKKEKK